MVLHPVAGPLLLAAVLFLMFQAVFSWAKVPQNLINAGVQRLAAGSSGVLPQGPLRGLCSMACSPAPAACSCFCRRS